MRARKAPSSTRHVREGAFFRKYIRCIYFLRKAPSRTPYLSTWLKTLYAFCLVIDDINIFVSSTTMTNSPCDEE